MIRSAVLIPVLLALAAPTDAQQSKALSGKQLTTLLQNGAKLTLGGPGEGYSGSVTLKKNGTGKGSATTDAGRKIRISGTWAIKDDMFCRVWKDLNNGQEVCETWVATSPRSVDVYVGDKKIGVNSW